MRYFSDGASCVWRLSPDGSLHWRWRSGASVWAVSVATPADFITLDGAPRNGIYELDQDPFA